MKLLAKVATGSLLIASLVTVSACRTPSAKTEEATLKDASDLNAFVSRQFVRINRNYEDSFRITSGQNYTDGLRLEFLRTRACDLEATSIRVEFNNGDSHIMTKDRGTADSSIWTRYEPRPVGLPRPTAGGDGSLPVGMPMPADDDVRPVGMPVQPDVARPVGLPMPISIAKITVYFSDETRRPGGCYLSIHDYDASLVRPVGLPMPAGDDPRPVGLPMPSGDSDAPRPVGMPVGW